MSYPALIQARREGFREPLDIASLGVPYASTGITVRKGFLNQRRDVVTSYVKSILEATARIKRDKAFTIEMMMKYFGTKDREMMEETYEVSVTKYLKPIPTPSAEDSFRTVIDELALVNPKAKGQNPETVLRRQHSTGAGQERLYRRAWPVMVKGDFVRWPAQKKLLSALSHHARRESDVAR